MPSSNGSTYTRWLVRNRNPQGKQEEVAIKIFDFEHQQIRKVCDKTGMIVISHNVPTSTSANLTYVISNKEKPLLNVGPNPLS
jgi:hypothetical protein